MKKLSVLLSLFFIIVAGGLFLSPETKVSGHQDIGWKVWVKTSPCSGRFDWVSVAKENPTYGGGGGFWQNADLIIVGTGMRCVRNIDQFCTKAQAEAEAVIVRAQPQFSEYCCKEYSVWRNQQTSKMSVVVGKFGKLPPPWEFEDGPMCCDEAEALSGITGACGSGTPGGGTGFGPMSQSSIQGTTLTYYRGTTPEKCQADCGANLQCKAFTLIKAGAYNPGDPPMCYLISAITVSGPSSCCISAVKGSGGGGGGGGGGAGGNTGTSGGTSTTSGQRRCNASEQALWARITGAWEANYGPVTFSGSCENVAGHWLQGEWGERGTSLRGVIKSGRVSGSSLTFNYSQSWNNKTGSDSCYLSADGKKLECSYMQTLQR